MVYVIKCAQCPFHGLIIARDEQGRPVNNTSAEQAEGKCWSQHPSFTIPHYTVTATTAAAVEEVSWQDIEEDISAETGTIKLPNCLTLATTVHLVGELEWKHTKKEEKLVYIN